MISKINLGGEWEYSLSAKENAEKSGKELALPTEYSGKITLPDSVQHAGVTPLINNEYMGFFTDTHEFTGRAWFAREFTVGEKEAGKEAELFLERTRITTVFLDGKLLGRDDSLCAPHRVKLEALGAGKHSLAIAVDNFGYPTGGGHMTSPDTQTNWLGILGRLEIRFFGKSHAENIMLFTDTEKNTVTVKADIAGVSAGKAVLVADGCDKAEYDFSGGKLAAEYLLGKEKKLWDEYHRNLYSLTLSVGEDSETISFGMRKFSSDGLKLSVNGKQIFLRGKHDGMVFPETGYAPTETEKWQKVFQTVKQYGINHYRFHTCCPPEAAFCAADIEGIYLEPELPFWGTIAAKGEDGYNEAEQEYLIKEGFKILREFGNHPSFMMLSLGNELWGSGERLNEILGGYKKFDDRRLYSEGSNNFQFYPQILENDDVFSGVRFTRERLFRGSYAMCDAPLGYIQTDRPSSSHLYDDIIIPRDEETEENGEGGEIEIQFGTGVKKVRAEKTGGGLIPTKPVISHEIGQYNMFPDFSEEESYKGFIKPLFLKKWRADLTAAGIYGLRGKMFDASAKFCVECYKSELESAIMSENLSGFQLLDLQDFPGQGVANVGILNARLENKGAVSPEKWRGWCADVTLSAAFDDFTVIAGSTVETVIRLANSSEKDFAGEKIICRLAGENVAELIELIVPKSEKRVTEIGKIAIEIPASKLPQKLTFSVSLESGAATNEYTLWSYPQIDIQIDATGIEYGGKRAAFAHSAEGAERLHRCGAKSIVVPKAGKNAVEGTYCADFWNYHMFALISRNMGKPEPIGTHGLLIDDKHPIFELFPTECFTTPQWYDFISHGHCEKLDETKNVRCIVRTIDNTERCLSLGMLYEADGLLYCTSRLWEAAERPEIKWLARSIVEYLNKN